MLNKYFYQNKAKLYQNFKNITLLKIPLTLVLGTSGQGKGPSPTNTWQSILNILLKTSLTCMQMISKNMLEVKTLFYMSGRQAGYQPGLCRGPTPPGRGVAT